MVKHEEGEFSPVVCKSFSLLPFGYGKGVEKRKISLVQYMEFKALSDIVEKILSAICLM